MPLVQLACLCFAIGPAADIRADDAAEPPEAVRRWLVLQEWERDAKGPVVALGEAGKFDDTYIFAPCVAREDGRYRLWYPGSRGSVEWVSGWEE